MSEPKVGHYKGYRPNQLQRGSPQGSYTKGLVRCLESKRSLITDSLSTMLQLLREESEEAS